MRSELVFGAMTYVSNRFLLTRVTATATANCTGRILVYRTQPRSVCVCVMPTRYQCVLHGNLEPPPRCAGEPSVEV